MSFSIRAFAKSAVVSMIAVATLSCGAPNPDMPDGGGGGDGGSSATCGAQAIAPAVSGGCVPRFATPAVCQEVDLTNGRTFEIGWTTDGTGCETPWRLCVAGNPVSDANSACAQLSTNVEAGISRTGGLYYLSANDLQGLTSDNGVFHLLVASFYQSHNGTLAFRVRR